MRQILSTAVVAVVVGALAGVTASAIAQTPGESAITPSAVTVANADKVDGKHAVGYTTRKAKRAGKLVATDANGLLPPNIVNPFWGNIKNVPAGFKDGVDDGVTGLTVTKVNGATGAACTEGFCTANGATCPAGSVLVGGGSIVSGNVNGAALIQTYPSGNAWYGLGLKEAVGGSAYLTNYALCLSVGSGGPISTASKGKAVSTRARLGN